MTSKSKGILARLKRCERGNVLPMMAAALVPILVTIGGGVDYARASLAKAKLQEAVDSAALAGRRGMSRDDIETARPHVEAFMRFNYPDTTYGTEKLKLTLTKPDTGVVRVKADTSIKTTLLTLVGIDKFDISAIGEATQNLDNVDIVLVLDTTGSMKESLGGRRKIEALKDAVRGLYDELEPAQTQLRAQNLRLRIGVVPYSSTVNVGKQLVAAGSMNVRSKDAKYFHWYNDRSNWKFGERTYDLDGYIRNSTFGTRNGHSNNANARWKGCIEERGTIATITANDSRNAPPAGALDLDIDAIPGWDEKTKWQPYIFGSVGNHVAGRFRSEIESLHDLSSDGPSQRSWNRVTELSVHRDLAGTQSHPVRQTM